MRLFKNKKDMAKLLNIVLILLSLVLANYLLTVTAAITLTLLILEDRTK